MCLQYHLFTLIIVNYYFFINGLYFYYTYSQLAADSSKPNNVLFIVRFNFRISETKLMSNVVFVEKFHWQIR